MISLALAILAVVIVGLGLLGAIALTTQLLAISILFTALAVLFLTPVGSRFP